MPNWECAKEGCIPVLQALCIYHGPLALPILQNADRSIDDSLIRHPRQMGLENAPAYLALKVFTVRVIQPEGTGVTNLVLEKN